jgi:hypothetical protein
MCKTRETIPLTVNGVKTIVQTVKSLHYAQTFCETITSGKADACSSWPKQK